MKSFMAGCVLGGYLFWVAVRSPDSLDKAMARLR